MPGAATITRAAGFILGLLLVVVAVTLLIGQVAWRRSTRQRLAQLRAAERPDPMRAFTRADLADLPAPVARYLAFALPEGQPRIRVAHVQWNGDMRLQPSGPWTPFTAEQTFTAAPPGFVWDARFRMMPLIPVFVRDGYHAGAGRMLGRLGGVINVVNDAGTPEMAQSALARWLGEAAWFPTALLPGDGVTWHPIDDSTARATVSDGALSVSADFQFAATGELLRMSAMRYRDVDGRGVLTPFEGHYSGFVRRQGVMIPSSAEVAWLLPEGRYAYWRGEPAVVRYEFEPNAMSIGSPR